MKWQEFIVSDQKILLGKPCIKGTRISVEFIVQLLASGWTENQIFENYPQIKPVYLQAVFAYIYDNIHDHLIYNFTKTTNDKIAG